MVSITPPVLSDDKLQLQTLRERAGVWGREGQVRTPVHQYHYQGSWIRGRKICLEVLVRRLPAICLQQARSGSSAGLQRASPNVRNQLHPSERISCLDFPRPFSSHTVFMPRLFPYGKQGILGPSPGTRLCNLPLRYTFCRESVRGRQCLGLHVG